MEGGVPVTKLQPTKNAKNLIEDLSVIDGIQVRVSSEKLRGMLVDRAQTMEEWGEQQSTKRLEKYHSRMAGALRFTAEHLASEDYLLNIDDLKVLGVWPANRENHGNKENREKNGGNRGERGANGSVLS